MTMRPSLPIEFRSRPVGWVQTRKMRRSVGEAGRPCLGARTTAWRSSRRHGGPLSGPMQKAPPDGRRPMLTLVWGSRDLQPSKRTFVPLRDSVLGPGCVKTPKRKSPLEFSSSHLGTARTDICGFSRLYFVVLCSNCSLRPSSLPSSTLLEVRLCRLLFGPLSTTLLPIGIITLLS